MKKILAFIILISPSFSRCQISKIAACKLPRNCPDQLNQSLDTIKTKIQSEIDTFLQSATQKEVDELALYLKYCPLEFTEVPKEQKITEKLNQMPEELRPGGYDPARNRVAKLYETIKCYGNSFYGGFMYVNINGQLVLSSITSEGINFFNNLLEVLNRQVESYKKNGLIPNA